MKNINVKYKYGHLWDIESGQRIVLRENAKFSISIDNSDIDYQDFINHENRGLSSSEQERLIKSMDHFENFEKILKKGDMLYFDIKLNLKNDAQERIECEFELILLEDLYIYTKNNWKEKEPKLFNCACIVQKETTNHLEFFEPINAFSINNAYEKTFTHYFANHGSPTCNVYDKFYEYENRTRKYLKILRTMSNFAKIEKQITLFDL